MPTFTVHAPPPKQGQTTSAPERFVFVRDGFYVWAFVLAPLWLLWRRLWLAFLGYLLASAALGVILTLLGVSPPMQPLASLVVGVMVGFEASTLWRWTLTRRGWHTLGFVVGDDREAAEQRFFSAWTKRAADLPAPPVAPAPQHGATVRRLPPSPSDVIGLFPEPELKR
jgi:hypothetical protein